MNSPKPARLLLLIFATGSLHLPANADDYTVTATGSWTCINNGVTLPLAHARVELRDSDVDVGTLGDDVMAVGLTDDQGRFVLTGQGGDPGNYSWSRPDVYVQIVLTDEQGVRLTDEVNNEWNANTPQHDHDNVEGNVDIGDWSVGTQAGEGSSRCGVWLAARAAYQEYVSLENQAPPAGHYDVEYWAAWPYMTPWTNLDTTHWPTGYETGAVNRHEFAHSVRHSFDGDQNHFNWDVTRFVYARSHSSCDDTNEGFAFNEGWAEFWADTPQRCGNGSNMEQEGNVATALAALTKCKINSNSGETLALGRIPLLHVLRDWPEQIHSFAEFLDRLQLYYPNCNYSAPVESINSPLQQVDWSSQARAAEESVAKLNQAISSLTTQWNQARLQAAHPPACTTENCLPTIEALTKPILVELQIHYAELVRSRVQQELSPEFRHNFIQKLNDGSFDKQFRRNRQEYFERIVQLDRTALQRQIEILTPLRHQSKIADQWVEILKSKLVKFEIERREGKPLPATMQPSFSIGKDVVRRAHSGGTEHVP